MLDYLPEELFIEILSYLDIKNIWSFNKVSTKYKKILSTEKVWTGLLWCNYRYVCHLLKNKQFEICSRSLYYDLHYNNKFDNYAKYGKIDDDLLENVLLEDDCVFIKLLANDNKFIVPDNLLDIIKDRYDHTTYLSRYLGRSSSTLSILYELPKFRNKIDIIKLLHIFIEECILEEAQYIINHIISEDEYTSYVEKHGNDKLLMVYMDPDKCKIMRYDEIYDVAAKMNSLCMYDRSHYICDNYLEDADSAAIFGYDEDYIV